MITGAGSTYFKSISGIPDLTKEKEIELFTKLRKLERQLKTAERSKRKTVKVKLLIDSINAQIKNQCDDIFYNSQKTLYLIARPYFKYVKNSDVCDEMDLIQEASLAVLEEVIHRFDIKRNLRFSTYAYWWIRQRITKYLENTHMIKVPHSFLEKAKKDSNIIIPQVCSYDNIIGAQEASSNNETGESVNNSFIECMADKNTFMDELDHKFLTELFNQIFLNFSEKEVAIIKLRFGFSEEPQTLAVVGDRFGVTRERIRQIEAKAIQRINEEYRDLLKDFYYKEEGTNG